MKPLMMPAPASLVGDTSAFMSVVASSSDEFTAVTTTAPPAVTGSVAGAVVTSGATGER